jgi:invasion protein IalB
MRHRDFVTVMKGVRAFAVVAAAAVLMSQAFAQQPPAPKAQPKAPVPKTQQPKAGEQPQAQQQEQPKLNFSPWTKVCPKGQEANAKAICLTGRDGVVETGIPVVAAVLIEPEGEPRKTLRVTLPLGMALQPGTRVQIDEGQPMTAPYVICAGNGCMADYEASNELIANMKKGKGIAIQGVNGAGNMISLVLPLDNFGRVHDGPATDPKQFEEMQRKRFEEFQKKQGQ